MSFGIQALPPDVVHLIAAGEVIDSLAAVVRELVENSLDAGATRIVISLWPDLWRVQVADNGRGMALTDLRICANAHSTSKIRSSDDLWKITSLGFRGEALHSLAQVADLEILSRTASGIDTTGWRIVYREGESVKEEAAAIAPGTIVTVSNLFGNWPVRRKGLPSIPQQLKGVQGTIGQIALCYPSVTWQVRLQERLWFNISPGISAQEILPQILKQVRHPDLQLLTLEVETPRKSTEKIELVLGLPDRCHRRRPDWVRVAVNGRIVRSPELEKTILAALARTLPRDRYPVCFLHLQICPSQIDWNRHPAKTEIYLHSLKFWQEQVAQAIEQALRISPANLPAAAQNQRVGKLLKASEEKGTYQLKSKVSSQAEPWEPDQKSKVEEIGLMELRAVAQVRNTYIVAEHPTGLWLIEQHIAHERVLYEQLQDDWKLVPLETPIILSQLTSAQLEQLQQLGLDIEPFGEQLWAARTAPEMLHKREDCTDALIELSWGGDLQEAQVATACRSAIRNGTPLNLPEMQVLLDQWKNTRNPRTCPHGRPIYLSLEESALARFFRRHWVIGKSHGI
ncbi:MAG: DNA mismatch repair endonuclease MutL [Xenococcaceae cyanobacterium]